MDEKAKRAIKKAVLALRKLLEKQDIPAVLKQHGIFPDRAWVPVEKLPLMDDDGRVRRQRLEAVIEREIQAAGGDQKAGVERYCREVAFTYLNRLVGLRCMEVRGLIDECVRTREDYAGRSLRHDRFRREHPGEQFDQEDTDSLKAFLRSVFAELQEDIKILFDPQDEYSIIMPSLQALRECIRALNEDIPEQAFREPELIGWVYQYFQTEEKDRVFEEVRTKKKKIEGYDIIPATSLYTERYMVDYLVQNSLGTIWMEMHPDSKLCENWPYFVKGQDLKPREARPVKSLTFLDPACGSGHFLLIAFDLYVQMYEEEARLANEGKVPKEWVVPKERIATIIIESNLNGIDIDLRSVQLSYLVLYLKMREHQNLVSAPKVLPEKVNLVAADALLLDTPEFLSWCEEQFREEPYALNIIKGVAGRLRNLPEIGSLARPEEDLKELIRRERERLLSAWSKNKGKQFAFDFYLTDEQKELPFEKITDEQFWDGLTRRFLRMLDVFLKRTREEMRERLFTTDLQRVIVFLDLCRKRYNVVATNPPYMGSKNMGKELKEYVQSAYPEGKRDLYAAFIQRNRGWVQQRGIVAMVTQQSWMFLRSFVRMREEILKDNCIQTLAHLGPHAFAEISGEVVNAVLFTLANEKPREEHRLVAFRVIAEKYPLGKRLFLLQLLKHAGTQCRFRTKQGFIGNTAECSIAYWLRDKFLQLLTFDYTLKKVASVKRAIDPSNVNRYIRFLWETGPNSVRWISFSYGGGYSKWIGFNYYCVDWFNNGYFLKKDPKSAVSNEHLYHLEGLTYTDFGRGKFGVRFLSKDEFFSGNAPAILCERVSHNSMMFVLNCRLHTYLLRAMSPQIQHFRAVYVESLPMVQLNKVKEKLYGYLALCCVNLKSAVLSISLVEVRHFNLYIFNNKGSSLLSLLGSYYYQQSLMSSILHALEGYAEIHVFTDYGVSGNDMAEVIQDLGTPAGWHPLITGYDKIPETDVCEIPKEVIEYLDNHERINPSQEGLSQIKSRLRALYEAGPGANLPADLPAEGSVQAGASAQARVEDVIEPACADLPTGKAGSSPGREEEAETSNDEDEAEALIGKRIPIPTETFLEELSVKMEIHPISIYWLLKEMREKEGLVCWPECKRYVEDYFTVMILRMLGFRWPKQVEANEPVPDWADKDGIIPVTEHTGERTLLERARDRIGAEFGEERIGAIEAEFADILHNAVLKEAEVKKKKPPRKKVTLAQWLEKEFFKRHVSQFKHRPIAWHLTSSNGTFQVILFYHKISADMLRNLKNIYLARVQTYYQTMLERSRKGETVPGGLTSGKLSDIVVELEDFAARLDQVMALPYEPLIDDGVRVNIAPLQKLGLLAVSVLAAKDVDRAIADRNRWREDDKEQNTVWNIAELSLRR